MIRITIHPLLLVVLLSMVFTGNIALYSIILFSLLLHELGHLLAARIVRVKVKSCVIMPYGGEIELGKQEVTHLQLLIIALGGPLATMIGMASCMLLPPLIATLFFQVQIYLLCVNLLPLLPLDGGKIICYALLAIYPKTKIYERFLSFSLLLLTILVIVTLLMLPQSIVVVLYSLFLWSKVIGEWKYRKYHSAYEKIVLNRLT
ncbi:site-2 protease family protein [Solibacillus sp. CAU 1738]|uniref:site-2 protease family protein n=1 Tax=Solibacillus sp. CAU 1738 TaxID=3140363 RepID=UPI0032619CBF